MKMGSRKGSFMIPLTLREDPFNSSFENSFNKRKASFLLPPIPQNSFERRTSLWNSGPRKSIFGKRMSFSLSSLKSSQDAAYNRVKLKNTYRLGPEEHETFKPYIVEPKIYEILENSLKDREYDAAKSGILSKELSQEILREVRNMIAISPRYKLLAHVVIGQLKGKSIVHLEMEKYKLVNKCGFYS